MFDAIKRWLGSSPAPVPGGDTPGLQVLAAWAAEEGHQYKTVAGAPGGAVVSTAAGWRVEWGLSQRPYIQGQELRFRFDSGLPADVQILLLTRALAQTLESDVFERFTDAMQTQVDHTLPEEMRWLAMHQKVSLSGHPLLARRFLLLSNAEGIARLWVDDELAALLEEAATTWWADALVMLITVNRGMLTARLAGDNVEVGQLKHVGRLFDLAARKLVQAA